MRGGEGVWSFESADLQRLEQHLDRFLAETGARCVLLVDRSGQLLAQRGETGGVDETTFASLAAADFAASAHLARLLGEDDFASLYHHSDSQGMFLADVAGRAILTAMLDAGTPLGLIRLKSRSLVPAMAELFVELEGRRHAPRLYLEPGWLSEAELEIDRLFGD